jgi:hypothetical protein
MPAPLLIIARTNGSGLDRDARLLIELLTQAGIPAEFAHCRSRPWWRRLFPERQRAPAAIFLERTYPGWQGAAERFFVIPNQERFPRRHIHRLRGLQAVLCKTAAAQAIFAPLGTPSIPIGFTSPDQLLPQITPDYSAYLHIAGRSTEKGTAALLELWAAHPQWPTLTLLQHPSNAPASVPANVKLITERLSDIELQELYNRCGVHLCPSRCEGWGHTLVEGMSARAVVITTDAPPMNEIISPQRGMLAPYVPQLPQAPRRGLRGRSHAASSGYRGHYRHADRTKGSPRRRRTPMVRGERQRLPSAICSGHT